jgi:hypothetical protein
MVITAFMPQPLSSNMTPAAPAVTHINQLIG